MVTRVLGLSVLAISGVVLAVQDGVLLRRTFTANTEDRYKIESVVKQTTESPMGSQEVEITTSMDYMVKHGAVDASGTSDVTLEVRNIKVDASVAIPEDQIPKDFKATGKLDSRMRLTDVKIEGTDEQAARWRRLMTDSFQMVSFPEGPVKAGETWEWTLPKNPILPDLELKVKVRFDGDRAREGKTYHILSVDERLPLDVDLSKAMEATGQPGGEGMRMKGTIGMKFEVLFEKDSCRLFSVEGVNDIEAVTNVPQINADVNTKATVKTSIKLVQ